MKTRYFYIEQAHIIWKYTENYCYYSYGSSWHKFLHYNIDGNSWWLKKELESAKRLGVELTKEEAKNYRMLLELNK